MRLHAYIVRSIKSSSQDHLSSHQTPSIIISPSLASQIPRYIITLHELLAHTPPDHVEKNSLEHARRQLEDLSRQMHDEVRDNRGVEAGSHSPTLFWLFGP